MDNRKFESVDKQMSKQMREQFKGKTWDIECRDCWGKGHINKKKCSECQGKGIVEFGY